MTHPEELLAAYVDGTLESRARAEVDVHLTSCATCRDELELASSARADLASLPELDVPPGTIRPSLERGRVRRSDRFGRTAWATGFAAAAAVAAIFTLVVLSGHSPQPSQNQAAAGAPARTAEKSAAGSEPVFVHSRADYDAASIDDLASRLAQKYTAEHRVVTGSVGAASSGGGGGGAAPSSSDQSAPEPAPSPTPAQKEYGVNNTLSGGATTPTGLSAAECVRQGVGLRESERPVALIEARYQGKPVYIGAFLQDGGPPDALIVWVVSTSSCRVVDTAAHPLG